MLTLTDQPKRFQSLSSSSSRPIDDAGPVYVFGPIGSVLWAAPIGGTLSPRQVGAGQCATSASTDASKPVYSVGNLSTVRLVAKVR